MLPIGLELAVEVSRNAEGSGAAMWFSGNLVGIIFVLGMFSALHFFNAVDVLICCYVYSCIRISCTR